MKRLLLLFTAITLFSCTHPAQNTELLQNRIDSLESQLANNYKPGFGEFMSSVQAHHAKLWFAGENKNWKLADFELHEIMEAIEDIQKYQSEREESKLIGMINPALDSLNAAIQQQDPLSFKSSYTLLTNTCNKCHRAAHFEFNVIKIPDMQSFSNQDFNLNQ
jgi:hypothetical protein